MSICFFWVKLVVYTPKSIHIVTNIARYRPFFFFITPFFSEWEQSKSECDASTKKEEKAMMRAWCIQQGLFSVVFFARHIESRRLRVTIGGNKDYC